MRTLLVHRYVLPFAVVATLTLAAGRLAAEDPIDAVGDADAGPEVVELRSALRPSLFRKSQLAPQGLSAQDAALEKDNCLFGAPQPESGVDLGPIDIIRRKGYVLAHSRLYKIPLWVCEHALASEIVGTAKRDDSKFRPDDTLAGGARAELADYKGAGFDRGHQAPAGNFKFDQGLMDESFYLSNMVPQFGPTFNRGIWAHLEDTVRKWTQKRGECWIITGPLFYDPLEEDESTADGWVDYQTIGADEVAVPTHLYKIVVAKSGQSYEAITFVMANKHYGQPYRLKAYIATVDWVEARTGLDFLPELTSTPSLIPVGVALESSKSSLWSE